jgi:hypothetical protein
MFLPVATEQPANLFPVSECKDTFGDQITILLKRKIMRIVFLEEWVRTAGNLLGAHFRNNEYVIVIDFVWMIVSRERYTALEAKKQHGISSQRSIMFISEPGYVQ